MQFLQNTTIFTMKTGKTLHTGKCFGYFFEERSISYYNIILNQLAIIFSWVEIRTTYRNKLKELVIFNTFFV